MRSLTLALLVLVGCGGGATAGEVDDGLASAPHTEAAQRRPAPSKLTLTLTLETREGASSHGAVLAPAGSSAPAADADLTLHSFDCGDRGRWVSVHARHDVTFCPRPDAARVEDVPTSTDGCAWSGAFEAGGTSRDFTNVAVLVRRGERLLGALRVARHSTLSPQWYLERPLPPYDVELDFLPTPPP